MKLLSLIFFVLLACNNPQQSTKVQQVEKTEIITKTDYSPSVPTSLNFKGTVGLWDSLKRYSIKSEPTQFDITEMADLKLVNIDSTKAAALIRTRYLPKSVYLISTGKALGKYFPLFFKGEQYDSDQLSAFIGVILLDTLFESSSDIEFLSAQGGEFVESFHFWGEIKQDSLLEIHYLKDFDCEEMSDVGVENLAEEYSEIQYQEVWKMSSNGEIVIISRDTVKVAFCE